MQSRYFRCIPIASTNPTRQKSPKQNIVNDSDHPPLVGSICDRTLIAKAEENRQSTAPTHQKHQLPLPPSPLVGSICDRTLLVAAEPLIEPQKNRHSAALVTLRRVIASSQVRSAIERF